MTLFFSISKKGFKCIVLITYNPNLEEYITQVIVVDNSITTHYKKV